jgi:hypothetical protein
LLAQKSLLTSESTIFEQCKESAASTKESHSASSEYVPTEGTLQLKRLHLENLHRLTGVTAFQIPRLDGIGLRFEMFMNRSFQIPHYILLRKLAKTGSLALYKHTIPPYVPLKKLAQQYLDSNLLVFVRRVRTALFEHTRKSELVTQNRCLKYVKSIETDPSMALWKLDLEDGRLVYLVCTEEVEKAIIYDNGQPRWENRLLGPLASLASRLELVVVGS